MRTGQFKKGQSGNPKGKQPGTKNKKTQHWEAIGNYILEEGSKKYVEYLKTLKGEKFAHEFRAVMEYFKPKQQRKELVSEEGRVFTVNLRPAKKKK